MNDKYSPLSFLQLLNPDNSMTFNRFIAHAIGATETILYFSLVSKMTYYYNREMLDDEGYFYATADNIQESTTFTKRIQIPTLKRLEEIGLIKTKYDGIPRRKYYKVINDQDLIISLLEKGEHIAATFRKNAQDSHNSQQLQNVTTSRNSNSINKMAEKPNNNQQLQNVTTRSDKMSQQAKTNCHSKEQQNVTARSDKMLQHTYKSKDNKSKDINPNLSNLSKVSGIDGQTALDDDVIDMNDNRKKSVVRLRYEELIKRNIEYDWYTEAAQTDWKVKEQLKTIDEIVTIMLDVVCSTKQTIRVNSEEIPQETVKSRFMKIKQPHIDYIIEAMRNNTAEIRNIRSYLITALYNAPSTIENYYQAQVNHDMYGGDDY